MKILLLIIGILFTLFLGLQLYLMSTSSNIEQYPYTLVKKYEDIEIRRYESTLFTSIKLSSNEYEKASSAGFRALGAYIFGANEKKKKIAMTSPVTISLEDSMTVMFMVPKEYNKDNLPKPNQSDIDFKQEPVKMVAAISFGGWANSEKIEKYKQMLISSLEAKDIDFTDRFFFLGYNAPYETINRKNELIVELEERYRL